MDNNELNGTLPEEIGNLKLAKMFVFWVLWVILSYELFSTLNNNRFIGAIPSIIKLNIK